MNIFFIKEICNIRSNCHWNLTAPKLPWWRHCSLHRISSSLHRDFPYCWVCCANTKHLSENRNSFHLKSKNKKTVSMFLRVCQSKSMESSEYENDIRISEYYSKKKTVLSFSDTLAKTHFFTFTPWKQITSNSIWWFDQLFIFGKYLKLLEN